MEKTKTKTKTYLYSGVNFIEKELTNLETKKEIEINAGNIVFNIEINFDEDRKKWHPVVYFEGKKRSLGFFYDYAVAIKSVKDFIVLSIGGSLSKGIGS